jgi:hypothetical protein
LHRALNLITHLLGQVPYEPLKPKGITLPGRQKAGDYREPDLSLRHIQRHSERRSTGRFENMCPRTSFRRQALRESQPGS